MASYARVLGLIVALLFAPASAVAQIVNVLAEIAQRGDDGLGGELSGAFAMRGGNTSTVELSGTAAVAYRYQAHTVYVIGRSRYTEAAKTVAVSQAFEHLRYRYELSDWLGVEAYAQHEYDKFRRLRLRALTGAGPRLSLLIKEALQVALGTSYMLEHEELLGPSSGLFFVHRVSNYLQLAVQAGEHLRLQSTTFVQPRVGRPADVRVLSDAALVVKANASLSFRIACRVAYDSRPPAAVKSTDRSIESSVVITL